jgi:fatty acid desaturase
MPYARLIATVVWGACLAGQTFFLGIALYIVFELRDGAGAGPALGAESALILASLALSVSTVALSWLWAIRKVHAGPGGLRARPRAIRPGPEADAVARLVVASTLCEVGALAAVVLFLLTGNAVALAPYGLSCLALLAHFPGDRHWARLTRARVIAAKTPMIRS